MAPYIMLVCTILWHAISVFGNQTAIMPQTPSTSSFFLQSEKSTPFELPLDNVTTYSATLYPMLDNADKKIPLYLGGYFSLGGIWDGSGILPAVEMALEHINERTDILAEYELKMIWNDTQVSRMRLRNDLPYIKLYLNWNIRVIAQERSYALVNSQLGKTKMFPINVMFPIFSYLLNSPPFSYFWTTR